MESDGNGRSPYLRIRDLWKAFGDFVALRDISLDIEDKEFICFLGPSGCGKTTLLRAIAGLDPQTRGTIEQGGRDISVLPPAARDYGIVFQSYALFPNLSVERNIAFGLENARRPKAEIEARVAELLDLIDLATHRRKFPAQLSGGQQQRVALARAIASSPGLLLLDEPLSALDAKVRVHLRHEIKSLQRRLGITTIMVTHDQEEALSMSDRIVVMNQGVIEQVGTPDEIYRHPKSLFVASFIGEANLMPGVAGRGAAVALGVREFDCADHDFPAGAPVTVAIRPEDIVPHAGAAPANAANLMRVAVTQMEFLGSFWRTRLVGEFGDDWGLTADISVNAARDLSLSIGQQVSIALPPDRLLVFPGSAAR